VNVYLKTTISKQNIKMILNAGVPSSQALPSYLITAPPSVCVSDVIGALDVWIQNPKKIPWSSTHADSRAPRDGDKGAGKCSGSEQLRWRRQTSQLSEVHRGV